jgi:hypothetical protein
MVVPGMVGLSTLAPITPGGDAEFVHGVGDHPGRIADRLEALDHAGRRRRRRQHPDALAGDAAGQTLLGWGVHGILL